MTTTIRALAAGISLATAAVIWAGPGSADGMEGTYAVTRSNGGDDTWNLTACGNGCVNVAAKQWNGKATLSNGQWNLTTTRPVTCPPDLDPHPMQMDITWDAATLHGTETIHNPGVCGAPAGASQSNEFFLVKS